MSKTKSIWNKGDALLLEENFNAGREDSVDKETESMLKYINDEMMKRYLKKELEWL